MDLARAVSATISYANYFNFPLFPEEIHHWLICSRLVSQKELQSFLPNSFSKSNQRFRARTTSHTLEKIQHARKLVGLLKQFPGLRLIALTGSVAARNAKIDDDIDLFFITAPHTLWLVRPLVICILTIFFRRRHPLEDPAHAPNAFCPNFWLDTLSLTIDDSKQSLYTAHEVLQIVPLLDRGDTYQSFLKANAWTKKYLANAYQSSFRAKSRNLTPPTFVIARSPWRPWQSMTSVIARPVLAGRGNLTPPIFLLLAPFNLIFFFFQFLYMFPKKTTETVNLHAAHLHTTDYSAKLRHIII